jgi:hypothetical protein
MCKAQVLSKSAKWRTAGVSERAPRSCNSSLTLTLDVVSLFPQKLIFCSVHFGDFGVANSPHQDEFAEPEPDRRTHFARRELANGNAVYDVTDPDTGQTLVICLDEKIGLDFLRHCELSASTLPVCRDLALDDSAAANLALQCRLKTI